MYIKEVSHNGVDYKGFALIRVKKTNFCYYALKMLDDNFQFNCLDTDYRDFISTNANGVDETGKVIEITINGKDIPVIELYSAQSGVEHDFLSRVDNVCHVELPSKSDMTIKINVFLCIIPRKLDLQFKKIISIELVEFDLHRHSERIIDICGTFCILKNGGFISLIDYFRGNHDSVKYPIKQAMYSNSEKEFIVSIVDKQRHKELELERQKWSAKRNFFNYPLEYGRPE